MVGKVSQCRLIKPRFWEQLRNNIWWGFMGLDVHCWALRYTRYRSHKSSFAKDNSSKYKVHHTYYFTNIWLLKAALLYISVATVYWNAYNYCRVEYLVYWWAILAAGGAMRQWWVCSKIPGKSPASRTHLTSLLHGTCADITDSIDVNIDCKTKTERDIQYKTSEILNLYNLTPFLPAGINIISVFTKCTFWKHNCVCLYWQWLKTLLLSILLASVANKSNLNNTGSLNLLMDVQPLIRGQPWWSKHNTGVETQQTHIHTHIYEEQ